VLHLIENPVSKERERLSQAKIAELEERNRSLEEKVSYLQISPPDSHASSKKTSLKEILDEKERLEIDQKKTAGLISKLKSELANAEKNKLRHVDLFNKKWNDFRKVIKLVFGYNIDVLGEIGDLYRMQSVYIEDRAKHFMVRFDSGLNEAFLVETPITSEFQGEVMEGLENRRSYPVFFSAVTLNLVGVSVDWTRDDPS